jgi:transaldolase
MAKNYSLWIDYLERNFIHSELPDLMRSGVVGATSNPAIFKEAFLTSKAYEDQKSGLTKKGKALYEMLAISDVQAAADAFRPLYDRGEDGFVSIEVDPAFAHDAVSTLEEARALHKKINRPNVMIKVPATEAGVIAIKELAKSEIPVNATLVFGLDQTRRILKVLEGVQTPVVISIFVSRFDRLLDSRLSKELQAKAGIMNAAAHYNLIEEVGQKNIRALFASTGVKGDHLPADYYVMQLAACHAVNTAPPPAAKAYMAGGDRTMRLPIARSEIETYFARLADEGVDFDQVCEELLQDGLFQFEKAFKEILAAFE